MGQIQYNLPPSSHSCLSYSCTGFSLNFIFTFISSLNSFIGFDTFKTFLMGIQKLPMWEYILTLTTKITPIPFVYGS